GEHATEQKREPAEEKGKAIVADPPAEPPGQHRRHEEDQPGLEEIANYRAAVAHGTALRVVVALVRLVLGETLRRPVGLGRVAPARAVEGGDVLQGGQNVPVELDVGDVVHVTVRRQYPILVIAAQQRGPYLLTLVLVGVVLHLV